MANYYPKGHMISGSRSLLEKGEISGIPLQLRLQDLKPVPRTNRHVYTERDLTGAVAMFEKTRNLSHCERETNVPRKAIAT